MIKCTWCLKVAKVSTIKRVQVEENRNCYWLTVIMEINTHTHKFIRVGYIWVSSVPLPQQLCMMAERFKEFIVMIKLFHVQRNDPFCSWIQWNKTSFSLVTYDQFCTYDQFFSARKFCYACMYTAVLIIVFVEDWNGYFLLAIMIYQFSLALFKLFVCSCL